MPTLAEAETLWKQYRAQAEIILTAPRYRDTVRTVETVDTTGQAVWRTETVSVANPAVAAAIAFIEARGAEMLKKNNALMQEYVAESNQKRWLIDLILLGTVLLNVALVVGALLIVRRFVTRPARTIRESTERLSAGNLNVVVGQPSRDELGTALANVGVVAQHLGAVATFAEGIGQGQFDQEFATAGDQDMLGRALLTTRDRLQEAAREEARNHWVTDGLAQMSELLWAQQDDLTSLTEKVLAALIKYLRANQGAAFVVEEEASEAPFLRLAATYAWGRHKHREHQVQMGEDLLGQAWYEAGTVYLEEIPPDYVYLRSGIGEATPRSLLIVPLQINGQVVGMLEVASLRRYERYEIEFVEKLAENMASSILSLKVKTRTDRLVEQMQAQTEAMRTAEAEMRQQLEALPAASPPAP